jgi:hypothetical protein
MELLKLDTQLSKELINSEAERIIQSLENGEIDPLKAYVIVKYYEKLIDQIKAKLESEARGEAYKYEKGASVFGATIGISSTGQRLDYDSDTVYSELKSKVKAREDLLKTAFKMKESILDEETGEIVPKVPLKSPAKETLVITIK